MDIVSEKVCKTCGIMKPVSEFGRHKGCVNGLNICKACNYERRKAYNKEHPEAHRAASRKWELAHPEQRKAIVRAQYWKNPEKFRERRRREVREHPERQRELRREYRLKNPEWVRLLGSVKQNKRRACEFNANGEGWSADEQKQLVLDYCHRCAYCGVLLSKRITMDHIIPLSRGGEHSIDNIVPACQKCNSSKGAKPLLIWMYQRAND